MKYGINLLLFSDNVDESVLAWFPKIKELGFSGVEVPLFSPETMDIDTIRARAEKNNLAITTCGALPPNTRFYGTDPKAKKNAAAYIRAAIKATAKLGASLCVGPLYKAVGDTDESVPLEVQRTETALAFQTLTEEAADAGVTFAFEPLNRFETNLLNTVEQGLEFCQKINRPAAALLLDTFHLHIEEKDSVEAIKRVATASLFAHFHASENDRGVVGTGQVRWDEIAAAISTTNYEQWAVLETFNQDNQAIKTAVSCWRPFYDSELSFMSEGLAHLKNAFHKG